MPWKMKALVDDFFVKEISKEIEESEDGEYLWFRLRKKNWDFYKLLKVMARRLGVSIKRFGYAGVKDKFAVTDQLISLWKGREEEVRKIRLRDVEFYGFRRASMPLSLGLLKGNQFKIVVRNIREKEIDKIGKNVEQAKKEGVLNLYGEQRFGSKRYVNAKVGYLIVKGKVKDAVITYLTETGASEPKETREARMLLKNELDFRKALKIFPKHLKYELAILNHLARYENDYVGALRALPKYLRKMFVHAYQTELWNKIAKKAHSVAAHNIKIPIIGYETNLSKYKEIEGIVRDVMEEEGIGAASFKINQIPELSSKGDERYMLVFPKGIKFSVGEDELNDGMLKAIFEFYAPKGSYGTVIVQQFMKNVA